MNEQVVPSSPFRFSDLTPQTATAARLSYANNRQTYLLVTMVVVAAFVGTQLFFMPFGWIEGDSTPGNDILLIIYLFVAILYILLFLKDTRNSVEVFHQMESQWRDTYPDTPWRELVPAEMRTLEFVLLHTVGFHHSYEVTGTDMFSSKRKRTAHIEHRECLVCGHHDERILPRKA